MNRIVRAEGAGAIAVGGDAINSIFVTGGVNQFFVGHYERLADAYLSPRSLYRELHLEEFTGREWLLSAIDDFVTTADRGYLVIEAEAGMGKTAFMAWLAQKRNYVHHFVRLMPDASDVGTALRSMSAQLIRAWDLQTFAVGGVLPPNASRPDFFEDVLYDAAGKRDATRPGEAIVIVVDGLNETVAPAGQNPLALPANLPAGVYFVVSQRTTHVPLAIATARRVIRITPRSPENLVDVRAYLDAAIAQPTFRQHLITAGISPDELIRRLVVWSSGVWLVLRYVLAELRTGVRTLDNLETLPIGLWQYYARFFVEWQRAHSDRWADADLPLLVTLTAVQEPVPLALLCELSGGVAMERAALLVGDTWRPFLEVQEGQEERYRAYHESLVEFVAGQVDIDTLTTAERSFVRRLADAQRTAHRRIADRYLTAWGGVADALPGLRGEAAVMDDGYGLRQLVFHLVRGSADTLLHHLMELEWSRDDLTDAVDSSPATNSWYEAHRARRAFASYALDVERAWSYTEQSVAAGPTAPRGLALEFRYALMSASINSVTGNVTGDLLVLLIDDDMATPAQALDLVRETPDPRLRAEALTALLPRLPAQLRDEAEREALSSAQAVPDGYWRAGELVRLVAALPPAYLAEIERLADLMSESYYCGIVRRAVAAQRGENYGGDTEHPDRPDVPESSLNPEDPAVFGAQYRERTDKAVATLVAGSQAVAVAELPAPQRQLAASRFIPDPRWRSQMLVAAAREEPPAARAEILRAALAISLTVGDGAALASAIRSIAAAVARHADLATALTCTEGLRDPEARARALFAVAAAVGASERSEAARVAVRAAEQVDDVVARRQLLRDHAAQLGGLVDAAELARIVAPESQVTLAPEAHPTWQAEALAAAGDLAAALRLVDAEAAPETRIVVLLRIAQVAATSGQALPDARDPVEEAQTALLSVTEPAPRSRLVVSVAVALAARGRSETALDLVHSLPDDDARTAALLPLAPHLQPATVGQAVAVASEIGDAVNRARVLAALTPLVVAGRPTGVQEHVRGVLHLLAGSTRAQLLEALPDLLPGLTELAGNQVLVDIAAAVLAVYRWWP
jgi:hypothetical protein